MWIYEKYKNTDSFGKWAVRVFVGAVVVSIFVTAYLMLFKS